MVTTQYGVEATEEDVEAALVGHEGQNAAFVAVGGEPRTHREAMQSPHAKQWEAALAAEFAQLKSSGTFEWVKQVLEGCKVIGSKAVYWEKHNGEGKTVKYKVQIIMKGYSQIPGQDFDLTFSSVASSIVTECS